jgi:hypothetical protein
MRSDSADDEKVYRLGRVSCKPFARHGFRLCRPTDCPSAAASAAKGCQNANDLVREAVGCTGLLDAHLARVCLLHRFDASFDPKRASITKEIPNQWMPNDDPNMHHILMLRIHALSEADNSEHPLPEPTR